MSQIRPTLFPRAVAPAAPAPAAQPRRKPLGPAYWAGLTFGLVCILLGLVIGVWGARILPSGPARAPLPVIERVEVPVPAPPRTAPATPVATPAPAPAPPAAAPPAAVDAPPPVASLPIDSAPAAGAPAADTGALEARVAELEARQKTTASAAAGALAVASLAQAAEGSAPFAAQAEAAARVLPPSPDMAALRELAVRGAPSRPALAAAFPAAAQAVAIAARRPGPRAGIVERALWQLNAVVTLRRTDRFTGPGADAILARAGRAAAAGDLEAAVRELSTLSSGARAAAGPWRADAERRIAIDHRVTALRAAAAAALPPAVP